MRQFHWTPDQVNALTLFQVAEIAEGLAVIAEEEEKAQDSSSFRQRAKTGAKAPR